MKIAVIAPTSIPSRRANTFQVMKMSQALVEIGHTVRLIAHPAVKMTTTKANPSGPEWETLAEHYGLDPTVRFEIQWLSAQDRLRRYDFGWQAVRVARQWNADLLYTRLPQAGAIASQAGTPTVLEVHDLPQGKLGNLLFRWFVNGRGAYRLVVITRALADDLRTRFSLPELKNSDPAMPFTIIAPDGVDLARYQGLPRPMAARQALGLARPEQFTAGYTGHLYAGRGADLILELAKRLPEVNFLIAGGEPGQVEHLAAECRSAKLENLTLLGFISNTRLPLYQAACEALLMPYQRQVAASSGGDIARYLSPMKVFEYLACGRAILSSDLPVLREVLNPENAILLPMEDIDAWATAIRNLQENPVFCARLAEQARRDAQKYSWEARARHILEPVE
ncbi:MAG: glycosyltransferase [Anaerolineales bacterium]|nr:glycosyltransferase [Anaerolineales bacterium]